ncbi:MAG: GNAT family N-acetyltransferase [Gemmatimonadota bacterium]
MPASDSYDIAPIEDDAEWEAFAAAAGASPFASLAWLRCAQAGTGDPYRLYGCRRHGRLVAAASGLERRAWGARQLVTPPLLPHGGFLMAPPTSERPSLREAECSGAFRALIGFLGAEYGSLHLTMGPEVLDAREFTWAGWEVRPRYTYQLDLLDREAVWEGMERRTRTAIRKAEAAGFEAGPGGDTALLRRLYEQVYARQNEAPPVHPAVVEAFAEAARQAGLTETWVVRAADGEPAAAVVFAGGGPWAFAWVAGADPELRDSGAAALLYWRFLQQTAASHFDFVGANIPGIALFKRGFGCRLVPYLAVEAHRGRLRRGLVALRRWQRD